MRNVQLLTKDNLFQDDDDDDYDVCAVSKILFLSTLLSLLMYPNIL